ncbi:MAG: hypothetical protein U1E76_22155 [Planctomycetota bacterium]
MTSMRRRDPHFEVVRALRQFETMLREQLGLKLLLAQMPAGSTIADARRLREKIMQTGRRPCRMLDDMLGIRRD